MNGKHVWRIVSAILMLGIVASAREALGAAIAVNTVGSYAPGVVGGPTFNDALSNSGANGIPLAVFQPLVAAAYASNTGGTLDFETANNWITSNGAAATAFGDGAANPITASYGVALSQTLGLWRTDVDGALLPLGIDASNNNGVNVVSGTHYMGIRGVPSPVNLAFSKGLSALGLVFVPRGAARTVTMNAVLDNASLVAGSAETIAANNTPGAYFWGFRAPAGRTIVGLNILSPNGFARFDDLGFVAVPEPSCVALVGIGCLGMLARRRRR